MLNSHSAEFKAVAPVCWSWCGARALTLANHAGQARVLPKKSIPGTEEVVYIRILKLPPRVC